MNKSAERRTLDTFLAARGLARSTVQPHERPDFLVQIEAEQVGVEVTRLIEANPRQPTSPLQWEAEAQRACDATRRAFESGSDESVVVYMQFRPECRVSELREPSLPAELAATVSNHLRQSEPALFQAHLVRDPHRVLRLLYAARLSRQGESVWRLGGASEARPATCQDVVATVAAKEPLVAVYRQATPKVWLLIDCDLPGQGVSLLVPKVGCRVVTTFDAVFCIDFSTLWREVHA
jgi:hypothetical protein